MSYPPEQELRSDRAFLTEAASLYLDALRLFSALLVFAYHASAERLNGQWIGVVGNFGHDAVIVFFVLSGFVIAYTSARRTSHFSDFMQHRLARLYSVVIPALLFTVFADYVGQHLKPEIYILPYYEDSVPIARFLSNLFFVNEIWFTSWRAFSNGPFWSLSYEFFYYLIFATTLYLSGWRRIFYTCLAALVAGPKILLLLPVWLIGVLLFYAGNKVKLRMSYGLLLVFGSLALYAIYRYSELPDYFYQLTREALGTKFVFLRLDMSRWFINDYIVALLVSINIFGFVSISHRLMVPQKLSLCIRYLASMTFALYLLHYPLLQLYSSMLNSNIAVVLLSLATVVLIAPYTEGKKIAWLKLIKRLVNKVQGYSLAPNERSG